MREYEVIREIENSCSNNQMRDVFFEEIECESPLAYVRSQHAGKEMQLEEVTQANGNSVVYVTIGNVTQKYIFTPI